MRCKHLGISLSEGGCSYAVEADGRVVGRTGVTEGEGVLAVVALGVGTGDRVGVGVADELGVGVGVGSVQLMELGAQIKVA
jgi:hypothetical protein